MRGVKPPSLLTALALTFAGVQSGHATSPVALETHVVLRVEALTVEEGRSKNAGLTREAEVGPSRPGTIDLLVPWGPDGATVTVRLTARLTSSTPDGELALQPESSAGRSGRPPVVASREIRLADEGSGLFE